MEFNINSVWIIIGACMLMILVSVISQMRNDLKHMKITLDKIAERFGAIEIVTKEEKEELKRLLSGGKNVQAVRRCREITGLGLKEAKEYVDGISEEKID
ncbi:ribosomal protein L7/L12 [Clostridium perfringens]|uniref:ribosomal protein L7/L12 n=1 Tax=Clostridium perfringens TaxID=1502 RepID=UPI0018E4B0D0|nr:ribosomal protein L7/L12 [Clostridium perfringens]MBI6062034.1 ribosomal protein L7/L12 [Clostridium perfringens]